MWLKMDKAATQPKKINRNMDVKEVLLDFLNQPLDTADGIFEIFATIPAAKVYQGNKQGKGFY